MRRTTPRAKFYRVYSGDTRHDHDLRIAHLAIDRDHTSGEDQATWFPLAALRRAAASGRIGAVAPRFHGAPTNRSQRATLADAEEIVARCRADGVDAALLVANCPVCHQTLALVARALEVDGIATVVMGCAKDIVEHVGVPRFLFTDFPLGNAAGRPRDPTSQDTLVALALDLLEAARRLGRRFSRRCAGAAAPIGSSTTATSPDSHRKRSRAAALPSTPARHRRNRCASGSTDRDAPALHAPDRSTARALRRNRQRRDSSERGRGCIATIRCRRPIAGSALAALQDREAAADAAAQASAAAHGQGAPSAELLAARRLAARRCLASRGDLPATSRSIQPPIVVAPIAPAAAARSPPTVTRTTPAAPAPAERPRAVTACDPGGCWADDGSRLTRIGPNLWGKRGICTLQGSLLLCP